MLSELIVTKNISEIHKKKPNVIEDVGGKKIHQKG